MTKMQAIVPGVNPMMHMDVESLASYIGRIALCYGISTGEIINLYLAPFLKKKYLLNIAANGGTRFYENSSMILNSGKVAADFCRAVSSVSGQQQLEQLTLRPYHEVFALRGIIYARRRWCPACFNEWLRQSEPIRDLLMWAMQPVMVCVDHGVYLQCLCPACGRSSHQLERNFRPGFCPRCGVWLGLRILHSELVKPSEEDMWSAHQVRLILSQKESTESMSPNFFMACLKQCGSLKQVSKRSGTPLSTLSGWVNLGRLPPLNSLLKISWSLRLPIVGHAYVEEAPIHIKHEKVNGTPDRTSGMFLLRDGIAAEWEQKALVAIANRYPPPSLRQVARELNTSPRQLRHYTPDLCRMISAAYCRYVAILKERRREEVSKELRITFKRLALAGAYPSRRMLEKVTGRSALLRENAFKIVWNSCFESAGLWES